MTSNLSQFVPFLESLPPGTIGEVKSEELDAVVAIHLRAFPATFITPLGPAMVRLYYDAALKFPNGRCIVYRNETGAVVGFVTSVPSVAEFYRWLMRRYCFRAAGACIRSSPKALLAMARRLFTRLLGERRRDPVVCADAECTAFAVDPLICDASIAPLLTAAFLLDAKRRGLTRIRSGVRVDNPRLLRMAHMFGYRDLHREARPDGHEIQILLWSEDPELGDVTS